MNVILLVLAILGGVAVIVMITQRFGKPMSNEQMARLSPILIFLVFAVLIGNAIYYFFVK